MVKLPNGNFEKIFFILHGRRIITEGVGKWFD